MDLPTQYEQILSCMHRSKSSVANILCLVSWCCRASLTWGSSETSYSTMHGATLTTVKEGCYYKVVKPIRVTKGRGTQTIDSIASILSMHWWRDWGSNTNSCHHIFGHKDNFITIVLRSQTITFVRESGFARLHWWWASNIPHSSPVIMWA